MTIQEFTSAKTSELLDFQQYWFKDVYPMLSDEDKAFWDYNATLWDWAELYDNWVAQ
jgi:hypothetical protein